MTLQPVVPLVVLVVLAAVLVGIRVVGLRRALRRTNGAGSRVILRWSGLTLAVLLLMAAAARPGVTVSAVASGWADSVAGGAEVNVFFVVDRSVDSRVEDFGDRTTRMAGIRDDIAALIDHYPGAQFAVISFSSIATMDWPLSDDVWSLKPLIAGLSTDGAASADSMYSVNAAAAKGILATQLTQANQRSPGAVNLMFYFGEGAGGSRAPQGSFDLGAVKPSGGALFGYGTAAGGPIPQRTVAGQVVYATDARTGAVLNSVLDEPALRAIAGQLTVPYVHREKGQAITSVPTVDAETGSAANGSGGARNVELYWAFALAAAVLVLIETWLTIWQFRRRRSVRLEVAR